MFWLRWRNSSSVPVVAAVPAVRWPGTAADPKVRALLLLSPRMPPVSTVRRSVALVKLTVAAPGKRRAPVRALVAPLTVKLPMLVTFPLASVAA